MEQGASAFVAPEDCYNEDGCLLMTDPCGLHECGPSCLDGGAAKCLRNMQAGGAE